MKHFYFIEVSGFLWRAFHAFPEVYRSDGFPINALEGFVRMLLKPLILKLKSPHCALVFDADSVNFRHALYPLYKSQRQAPPENLIKQSVYLKEIALAFGFPCFESFGYEADDVVATLVSRVCESGHKATIVSSDKDFMQLISPCVVLFDHQKKKVFREKDVFDKFGVGPSQVIDVQGLWGDSADFIPGVKGIGQKTAASLISRFGSVEQVFENLSSVSSKEFKLLNGHESIALLSKTLATLKKDAPLSFDIESCIFHYDRSSAHKILKSFELSDYCYF